MKSVRLYTKINDKQLKQVDKLENLQEVEVLEDGYLLLDNKIKFDVINYDNFAIETINIKQERS